MDESAKKSIIQNIPLLRELAGKFNQYQVDTIDLEKIIYFLTQFESAKEVDIMIRLLRQVEFVDSARMTYLLKSAFMKLPEEIRKNPIMSSLGGLQDSSALICYRLLKNLFENEEKSLAAVTDINSLGNELLDSPPTAIILFDDNITSGTQLRRFFEELFKSTDNRELVKKPLTAEQASVIRNIPIRICYAFQLSDLGAKVVESIRSEFQLDLEIECGKTDFNNYVDYQSQTMANEMEATFAREFIRRIAEPLYADKEWDPKILYHRLLGYGNLGKLTVFYYNIPKSLLPVFWKYGTYDGKPWIPLFPEIKEREKMSSAKVNLDFMTLEGIRSWIDNVARQRKPRLSVGFLVDGELCSEITLKVPSLDFVKRTLLKRFSVNKIPYANNVIEVSVGEYQRMLEAIYRQRLSDEQYQAYKALVDAYNNRLKTYEKEVRDFISRYSSNCEVSLWVVNDGDLAATNFQMNLEFNTGELLIDRFDDMPEPSLEAYAPRINDLIEARIIPQLPYSSLGVTGGYRKVPFEMNHSYSKSIDFARIGHNQNEPDTMTITRMDESKTEAVIPYQYNFDEDGETHSGELKILYEPVDSIDSDLKEEIQDKLYDLRVQ